MKLLYIDAENSGISGDMLLASLLGLTLYPDEILRELEELKEYLSGVSKLQIELASIKRSGILLNQLKIDLKESKDHRTSETLISALNKFIDAKDFSEAAGQYARNVLDSLIDAEAAVHGNLKGKIHLHELSSVDTLIDILGVTKVLDSIGGFEKDFQISCSRLPLGGGTIKAAHGSLPIPAPATTKILENSNITVFKGPIDSELVTPTGAALLTNLQPEILPYEISLKKVVYSTGQKVFKDFLNILRLFYGEIEELSQIKEQHAFGKYIEPITVIETDVDDVSGEVLGDFITNIQKENILDVQVIPSTTKKNRPSYLIKVLTRPENKFEIIEKMIDQLGTLGVRFNTINRVCVDRKFETRTIEIERKNYDLRYKISFYDSESGRKIVNIKPEYEDLKKICDSTGLPLLKVNFYAQTQIKQLYLDNK